MASIEQNQEEGENDWFFDIIINFLRSPRWKTPVMSFLDQHCILFDSEEENKLEYTPIHNQFKNLVEELIGHLLAELGVTQEQFMDACQKAFQNPIHKKIVDQITAVDNFIAFKKLMCKRNAELNQQAMKMLVDKQIQEEYKNAKKSKEDENQNDDLKAGKQKTPAGDPKKNAELLLQEQQKQLKGGIKDKEMQEALRIAQEAERAEEEELMRKAIEESQRLEEQQKAKFQIEEEEEEKMIRLAIELSEKEEAERKQIQEKSEQKESLSKQLEQIQIDNEKVQNKKFETPLIPEIDESNLLEVQGKPAMSHAELKKLAELKRLKAQGKLKKEENKKEEEALPKIKSDILPPVVQRKGQFELIPDFLKEKEINKDLMNINDSDLMEEALKKQEIINKDSGLSMKELFEKKRLEAEKALEEMKEGGKGPNKSEIEERKARLLAQRDKLRQAQEEKRKQELEEFQKKTETKSDLFAELKKMDQNLKREVDEMKQKEEAERRLEMFKKLNKEIKQDNKNEKEAAYQKRVTELDQKDKEKPQQKNDINLNDGDDWLKGIKTFGADD